MTNGFENKATWIVSLWIDNDFDLYNDVHKIMTETSEEDLPDELHLYFDAILPHVNGVWFDLLDYLMDEINWGQIAEHLENEHE